MFVRTLAASAVAALVFGGLVPAARADFSLVSEDLSINRTSGVADFSLTFNQKPDFATLAADGTPANSFQVEFDGATAPGSAVPNDLTAVVRGDEIHVDNTVRVRAPSGNGGPGSGGWGPIVDAVPYSLTGNTVQFAMPTADLGWTGGAWQANVYSLADGDLTAQQTVTSIPAPPAFWGGLAGLVVVAGVTAVQRRRRASA